MSNPLLFLIVGNRQGSNSLACSTDCRRFRQRPGKHSGGVPRIELQGVCYPISRDKPNDWNKYAEHCPTPALSPEVTEEARSYRVADSEKEQQEEHRLRLVRDGHMKEVPNENSSKQRTRHNP